MSTILMTPSLQAHIVYTCQFLYDTLGYDNLLKEIEMIHYIRTKSTTHTSTSHVDAPSENLVVQPMNTIQEADDQDDKVVIIQTDKPHVVSRKNKPRQVPADDDRCTAILSNGERCSFNGVMKNKEQMNVCRRHVTE